MSTSPPLDFEDFFIPLFMIAAFVVLPLTIVLLSCLGLDKSCTNTKATEHRVRTEAP